MGKGAVEQIEVKHCVSCRGRFRRFSHEVALGLSPGIYPWEIPEATRPEGTPDRECFAAIAIATGIDCRKEIRPASAS
jgi:hypothetical protein